MQDESGKPIPYVTVWQYIKPNPKHIERPEAQMTMDDLWRVVTRYKTMHEFILDYGERPISNFFVTEMGNEQGSMKHRLDYQSYTGVGNNFPPPNPTNFGYAFIKRGYLPEKVEFTIPTNKSRAEEVIVLKRDLNEEVETAPYILSYERLRYELSEDQKNDAITLEHQKIISRFENELEQAAKKAIVAGDNKAAARIYIRMRYLPSVRLDNGDGISGYSYVDRESARSKRAWELAKQLDPDNLFIWIHTALERAGNQPNTPKDERVKNAAAQMELLIQKHGLAVWPVIYDLRAGLYANINQKEKSKQLYLEASMLEPKYKDWSKELE